MSQVSFFNEHPTFVLSNQLLIESALLHVFTSEGYNKSISLNIVLLTDEALLAYNKDFLNHDYYTDIITFPIDEDDDFLEAELYISIDRIKDNALQLDTDFSDEFHRVLVHGVLHLCNYNDSSIEEKAIMRSKEDFYLTSCFT